GAIDDQLTATFEEVEQPHLALGAVKRVRLLHRHPGHPSTLGSQRIASAHHRLLLYQQPLARSFPVLRRHYRWCVRGKFAVSDLVLLHLSLLVVCLSSRDRTRVRRTASSKASGLREQEHACADDKYANDSRDALAVWSETLGGDGCRHDGHDAQVHDAHDQQDRH